MRPLSRSTASARGTGSIPPSELRAKPPEAKVWEGGRAKGTGCQRADAPLLDEMRGDCRAVTGAQRQLPRLLVASEAEGASRPHPV